MSKYGVFETELRDEKFLCAALESMGFQIERHAEPVALRGYMGDTRSQKANVIIRKEHTGIGASNDVGFIREDGKYRAVISDYDRGAKFGDSWLGLLKQSYTEQRQMAVAKSKGYVFQGRKVVRTEKGPAVQLLFAVR